MWTQNLLGDSNSSANSQVPAKKVTCPGVAATPEGVMAPETEEEGAV